MAYFPFDTRHIEAMLHYFRTAYILDFHKYLLLCHVRRRPIASLPWNAHNAHFVRSTRVLSRVLLTKEGRSGVGILIGMVFLASQTPNEG